MNEYVILDANASVHSAWKGEVDPLARVLITTEKNGEVVRVIGTNADEVAGWERYFASDDWKGTVAQTDMPLALWASRSQTTMLATKGNLDGEGDDVALEAAEDIRDALEAETPEETTIPTPEQLTGGGPVQPEVEPPVGQPPVEQPPVEEPTENV